MDNKLIKIIGIALVILALGLGIYFVFIDQETDPGIKEPLNTTEFTFPATTAEITWEDREIFRSGLVPSAQGILTGLPRASTYYISLVIPPDFISGITGHQVVRYFNNEDEPLSEVYFRLYPNIQGGKSTVSQLIVNGNSVEPSLESMDTSLRVDLASPLQPGESLVLEMDFELAIPTEMGGNYGLYGFFDDVLVLDTFYPMIPAYDENGWYKETPQNNGDLTYQDASFYIVQVEAPADLVLASSGVVVDKKTAEGTQTTTYAAGPARDFYLGGSRKFVEQRDRIGDTDVRVLTLAENSVNQALAVDYAIHAIKILSDRFGVYPYTELEVISSPMRALGIEYPGITSILVDEFIDGIDLYGLPSAQMLESTLVHEVGHMWFYNGVGNDQQNEPWVDESITQYVTYLYYLDRYGNGSGYVDSWRFRWNSVDYAEIPIGKPAGEYIGPEYSGIVYGRGPLFYLELEEAYGLETVLSGIDSYYDQFLWDNAGTEDIRAALEGACECDLGTYFDEWIYD
jgi:hypothetical protein